MIGDRKYLDEAIEVSNGSARPPAIGAGPIERSSMVRAVLPCENCIHREVCAIRPLLDPEELQYRTPPSPHEAIRITLTAAITCAHYSLDPTVVDEPAKTPMPATFIPTASERSQAGRNGAAARKVSVAARQDRQARIDAELVAKPKPRKTWTKPADYADATNQALRTSFGVFGPAGRALGLGNGAIATRVNRMRDLGLLAPDVAAMVEARRAERLGGPK